VFQISRVLRTALDRRMAGHGLTFPQASLLIRCVRHPGTSPSQLMPHMGTDNAGVTRLADRLEAAGLVVRRAGGRDRRSITLEPTAAGAALAPELEQVLAGTVRQLLSGLSEEELDQLTGLLRRVMASAAELDQQ
jgi:DNA-binding MarR family transcriptional regulator